MTGVDIGSKVEGDQLRTVGPVTSVKVVVSVAPNIAQKHTPVPAYNLPGNIERPNVRAESILRDEPVRPRKLGHVVIATTNKAACQSFFTEGIRLKISDEIRDKATFMRCSYDRRNVLVQDRPVNFMHHTAMRGRGRGRDRPRRTCEAREPPRAAHLGPRPALGRLELLLLTARSRRKLL